MFRRHVRRTVAASVLLLLTSGCAARHTTLTSTHSTRSDLHRITVSGVDLHYTDRGQGPPMVFVHGGLADYREWLPTVEKLPSGYRALTYSRRYNFPNENVLVRDHSAAVEAEDLASLLREAKAAPAHVVGVSYGAYTALLLALKHPELVRTIVLAEPPLIHWLPDLPGGQEVHQQFMSELWTPAADAFRAGDKERALRVTLDYFIAPGAYDRISSEFRAVLQGNVREWEALTTSPSVQSPSAAGVMLRA